ncbi:MAG: GAF domain-containing protein, partial [Candidatus Kapabacteria bacterium]|nr:GAF domain-containing protein [Candidatus Kapabacteria bacterium]
TVALFFLNPSEKKLNLYSFITENNDLLSKIREFSIDNDILSEILINAKPEILSDINYSAILDILPYYQEPVEIKSFAGIPIFLNEKVIGILTLDSFEANPFDSNVIGYIANFTKLISSILSSLNEKFELIISAKTLDAFTSMQQLINQENVSFEKILKNAFDTISKILNFENIGFCNFSSQANAWTVQAVQGNEEFVSSLHNVAIDTRNGLIDKVLFNNESLLLSPIGNQKNIINNKIEFNPDGNFLAVPLKSISSSYGAIFVYDQNNRSALNYDLQILSTIANQVAATIEQFLYIKVFNNYAQIDPRYGILNPSALFIRLKEEIERAKDFNYPISLATLMIDDLDGLKSKGYDTESLYNYLITNLKGNIRLYNLIGEIEERIIAVVLNYTDIKELRIWCEKIRSEIAQGPVNVNGKKIIITVSIGAATLEDGDDIDKLTTKSLKMLQSSLNKSNTVSIY